MAKNFSTTTALDFDEIERVMKHSRVLRSQAFRSILRNAYQRLIGRPAEQKRVTAQEIGGCTSAA